MAIASGGGCLIRARTSGGGSLAAISGGSILASTSGGGILIPGGTIPGGTIPGGGILIPGGTIPGGGILAIIIPTGGNTPFGSAVAAC